MSDPFAIRGESIRTALLGMEQKAPDSDLFALGYMIPQVELVLELADYETSTVVAEDFDVTYWEWLQHAFAQDHMDVDDRERVAELWQQAISEA